MALHLPPYTCPKYGEEFCFEEDRDPVLKGDLVAYVQSILESGCPECVDRAIEKKKEEVKSYEAVLYIAETSNLSLGNGSCR